MTPPGRPGKTAALLFGGTVAFVVGERLVEAIRPALLLDPDPSWIAARLVLWIGLLSATSAAGAVGAALFLLWTRSRLAPEEPVPLPFRAPTLVLFAGAALAAGALFRFAWLDTLPVPLWVDDVSLIEPTLALHGTWRDFANSVRPAPYGVPHAYGSVGVLYLEFFRACLSLAGTTVFGVRLPSALAGVASVGTAMLLGRALLPAGGGALAGLALAGMRWNLILSRWGWVAVAVAPILDLAALAMLAGRKRRSVGLVLLSGIAAGLAAHVYLAAWVGAAALLLLAVWPPAPDAGRPWRVQPAVAFAVAFALAAAPLFLFTEGRTSPYFARASDHNLSLEIQRSKSLLPLTGVAADAIAAPWIVPDPTARHDLPRRLRLGWVVGAFVFVALAHAILRPRRELSAYLLANAVAAFAATVAGGRADVPNGYRFAYLSNTAAVAAAGGALVVIGMVAPARRRLAGVAVTGLLAIASVAGARDAVIRWTQSRTTFDGFRGQDTLLGRAAARWDQFGKVELDPTLGSSTLAIEGVRRCRLDPDRETGNGKLETSGKPGRRFRIVPPGTPRRPGERLVEHVQDAWGREWAWVYGGATGSNIPTRATG